MADLTAFSNSSFDPVTWIDSAIQDRPEEESLDGYIASLAMKLHVISQDYTDQLEGGMAEAVALMPRTISEITRLKDILHSLDMEMEGLATQLYEFDQRNIGGVEDLSRLDTLKLNMEKCRATLEEHARWSQLVREAKTIMESGGRFSDSADRLETLSKSLDILQYMPGHEERMATCNELIESLIGALEPRVLHDIMQDKDANVNLRESLYVYEKLCRTDAFIDIYTSSRPRLLESAISECFGSADNKPERMSAHKIPEFYGKVHGFLVSEAKFAASLFGEDAVPGLLCSLLDKVMGSLVDKMAQVYVAADYNTVEEFARRTLPLLAGSSEDKLYDTLSLVYGCFVKNPNILTDSEGPALQLSLSRALTSVVFDTASASQAMSLDGEEGQDIDPSMVDSEDIALMFERYGSELVAAVGDSFQIFRSTLNSSMRFLSGLRSRQFLKFLSPLVSQHIKNLSLKIDELRVGACLPLAETRLDGSSSLTIGSGGENDEANIRRDDQFVSAAAVARQFGIGDLGNGKGKVLLPCALRVLQAAGVTCRDVSDLELAACGHLDAIYRALYGESISLSQVASLLSAGNVDISVGGAFASAYLKRDDNSETEMRAFLTAITRRTSSTVSQNVFSGATSPLMKFKLAAESFFFDLTAAVPSECLKDLHLDDVWGTESSDSDPAVDEGNFLPQHAVTQVGEHLLSLLQELETFATTHSIEDMVHLKGDAEMLAVSSWKQLRGFFSLKDDEGCIALGRRSSCRSAVSRAEQAMFGMVYSTDPAVDGENDADLEEDDALRFVNEWLGAIADNAVGTLLFELGQVQRFSNIGKCQLKVDLEYLSNVVTALGLTQHPMILHLILLLKQDDSKLVAQVEFMPVNSPALTLLRKFDTKIVQSISHSSEQ